MLGLHKDKVELAAYDESWKNEFIKERNILQQILGDNAIKIEHVGSTSIPGLKAKPILDIAVAVENENMLQEILQLLPQYGYEMVDSIASHGEALAIKGSPENNTHYIHIEVYGSNYWNNHILFRDYLIKHPAKIKEYCNLKEEVVREFSNERKKYTAAKNQFITDIIKKAKNDTIF